MSDSAGMYKQDSEWHVSFLFQLFTVVKGIVLLTFIDVGLRFLSFGSFVRLCLNGRLNVKKLNLNKTRGFISQIQECSHLAARLYIRRTRCFERSLVTCILLRSNGVKADLCIGRSIIPPLEFHAWVEHDGQVVNDAQSIMDRFLVISRLSP